MHYPMICYERNEILQSGSSANRAERANKVADRQPDLDNASVGIPCAKDFFCADRREAFPAVFLAFQSDVDRSVDPGRSLDAVG